MYKSLHVKYPLFSDFDETWILTAFEKNIPVWNFTKIRPAGAELFHADGNTDRHADAKSRLSEFCKRTKKRKYENTRLFFLIFTVVYFEGKKPERIRKKSLVQYGKSDRNISEKQAAFIFREA